MSVDHSRRQNQIKKNWKIWEGNELDDLCNNMQWETFLVVLLNRFNTNVLTAHYHNNAENMTFKKKKLVSATEIMAERMMGKRGKLNLNSSPTLTIIKTCFLDKL